jgi:predicted butyrate kinase (DUF1464 family)
MLEISAFAVTDVIIDLIVNLSVYTSCVTAALRMGDKRLVENIIFSSNGEMLAHTSGQRLIIKTVQTLRTVETFTCDGVIGVSVKKSLREISGSYDSGYENGCPVNCCTL